MVNRCLLPMLLALVILFMLSACAVLPLGQKDVGPRFWQVDDTVYVKIDEHQDKELQGVRFHLEDAQMELIVRNFFVSADLVRKTHGTVLSVLPHYDNPDTMYDECEDIPNKDDEKARRKLHAKEILRVKVPAVSNKLTRLDLEIQGRVYAFIPIAE